MYNDEHSEVFLANTLGVSTSADDIAEALAFFDGWEDRYRYVIDLGRQLVAMPEALQSEHTIVHGCQSQVWLDHYHSADGKLYFLVASDAHIVKGLAAMVLAAYNAKTPAEIENVDIEAFFSRTELVRHISPTRGNGLRAMVGRIRGIADRVA